MVVAYLLAGRLDNAREAYKKGLVSENHAYALREIDHWVSQQPDRIVSNEAQECLADIRALLTDKQP